MINVAIKNNTTGIQSGEKIHHHDHVITLASLSTKNTRNKTNGSESPFLILFVAIIYPIEYKYNKNL